MSTAKILSLTPNQLAWLAVRCEGGSWLADDGDGTYSLRGGSDLLKVLRVCQERPRPDGDDTLVQVQALKGGGWRLSFGDVGRIVHEDDRSADRVLEDLKRTTSGAKSLFERFEAMAYDGDPRDEFAVPLTEEKLTRGHLRAAAQGARWLVKFAQVISLSPKGADDGS